MKKRGRLIVVDDNKFQWIYKGSKILIWDSNDKKHVFCVYEATGWSPDEVERGKWKKYFSITPKLISELIKKEGLCQQ